MRVFLSSTSLDLQEHRKRVDHTILSMGHESVAMERFGPRSALPVEECEREAAASDAVVCVVAHRCGHVPVAGQGSFTQREVQAARAAGKDVYVWLVDESYEWRHGKEQDDLPDAVDDAERVEAVRGRVRALRQFKSWLQGSYVCEKFTTPDDLAMKVGIALSKRASFGAKPFESPRPPSELRVVHALQPAPHFHGREKLVAELLAWVREVSSSKRLWSFVAAGGTGKTAVVEHAVARLRSEYEQCPGPASILVWSFYERPDADAFLRECNHLFLGEDDGPPGGRLERLQRGLRDGRSHLIVLDGLERVQEDSAPGGLRGALSDKTLALLLRVIASGLGQTRALVTSRFPLTDLEGWKSRGYRETRLDDLAPAAAIAVLRGWNVVGPDEALRAVAEQVGYHALSVAVIGSYLRSFAKGRIENAATFELEQVSGDDPTAAKLNRVLAFYAERLPVEERELLARLSVFPSGVAHAMLETIINAGGEVAGQLVEAKPRLRRLLGQLEKRGLVFEYDEGETWSAHPFLRDRFRLLLGCAPEEVFGVVAESLGAGLAERPANKPHDAPTLDRYERAIEATLLAGRAESAFRLYWHALGGYPHLGRTLGDFQRGYRILSSFDILRRATSPLPLHILRQATSPLPLHTLRQKVWAGSQGSMDPNVTNRNRSERALLANDLSLFCLSLGLLAEARRLQKLDVQLTQSMGDAEGATITYQNSSHTALRLGSLVEARALADLALREAEAINPQYLAFDAHGAAALSHRGFASHALGDIASARADFERAAKLQSTAFEEPLRGCQHARHLLELGALSEAEKLTEGGIAWASRNQMMNDLASFRSLKSRIELARGVDPSSSLEQIRSWTSQSGDIEHVIEAHLLSARHLLTSNDLRGALGEAECGLVHAEACQFKLLQIELLVVLGRIRLRWPDPPRAVEAATRALDLAQECEWAWGEADAAQLLGEAHLANSEPAPARDAWTQALALRRQIEHPDTSDTERWLRTSR